jgi:hypothetical protein
VLSGNPQAANVGIYQNIVLSVSDGNVVASLPAFTVKVLAASPPGPYSGTPLAVPGTIDAVHFDHGGEGVGYHDLTPGNAGGELRPDEGVDIRVSPSALDGTDVVNSFETGEWLAYTIDVATAGTYELWVRVSSAFGDSVFHVEIDGNDVTGAVTAPNTGNWDTFQWAGGTKLQLKAGRQVLRVVADHQYFDFDALTLVTPKAPPPTVAPPVTSIVNFSCSFVALPACALQEQAKAPGRATLTTIARDGGTALRLHTEPGDHDVANSGTMERDDVWLSQEASDGFEGHEAWWAHSIYFPDDFTVPNWESYVVFDFHNTGQGAGQANFHVAFEAQSDILKPGILSLIGYGGVNSGDGRFDAQIGLVQKNVWYDFVYHVRWSSGQDGFFDAWVNGKRVLAHTGPTLYVGQGSYLKLANYHNPVCDPYPACIGTHKGSSVIHDRVIRGTTAQAVSSGPLEGYLDLVNGVLTPRL